MRKHLDKQQSIHGNSESRPQLLPGRPATPLSPIPPAGLRQQLASLEEQLESCQAQVRDLLWDAKLNGNNRDAEISRLQEIIGRFEVSAIRAHLELEIAEERHIVH